MKHKGFSLVELFAVILLSSVVLVPLLFSLASNVEVNDRINQKNAASLVSISTIRGFDTIRFTDILTLDMLNTSNYVEFNRDNGQCQALPLGPTGVMNNRDICEYVLDQQIANIGFSAEEFRVFIYPQVLTLTEKLALLNNQNIPQSVRDDMNQNITVSDNPPSRVFALYISVYIEYDSGRSLTLVRTEVISDDLS